MKYGFTIITVMLCVRLVDIWQHQFYDLNFKIVNKSFNSNFNVEAAFIVFHRDIMMYIPT